MTSILLGIVRTCRSLFKGVYLKNEKHFPHFMFHLWYLHQIWNIFAKRMIVIATVFPKLQTVKDLVKPLSNMCGFTTSFDSQHVKWSQTLVKRGWEIFYHIFWSLWREMIWEISPLLNLEILGVFVHTLTADDKYPFRDCENFKFPIQMKLS